MNKRLVVSSDEIIMNKRLVVSSVSSIITKNNIVSIGDKIGFDTIRFFGEYDVKTNEGWYRIILGFSEEIEKDGERYVKHIVTIPSTAIEYYILKNSYYRAADIINYEEIK